jgi:hypothetical protein
MLWLHSILQEVPKLQQKGSYNAVAAWSSGIVSACLVMGSEIEFRWCMYRVVVHLEAK